MLVALERYSVKGIPEFMRNFPLIILIYIWLVDLHEHFIIFFILHQNSLEPTGDLGMVRCLC
jgi:hypothetical protein